jgi:hypothetical protein
MANIVYRKGTTPTTNVSTSFKGNALTNDELDGNFFGIDSEVQTKAPINNAIFTGSTTIPNAIISGGTANGLTLGNVTPAPATFTSVTTTGNVTVGDANDDLLLIRAGTQTSPALVKVGDLDTGIWFPANDIFAVSAGGSERIRFTSTLTTVTGDQVITGDLAVNGGDITTTVTTGAFNFVNTGLTGPLNIGGVSTAITVGADTGTLTLRNPTVVGGTSTTVNLWNTVATTINFGGVANLTIGASGTGTTTIRNATTAISNALTVGSTASITGNTTVGGTLGVTGATTLSSTLAVTSNATVGGTLGVTGVATLSSNATVGGTLGVTGATTLSSTLGVTGATTFNGNVTIGDAAADSLTVNARLATGLTWVTDNINDIGASGANRARDLFLGRNAAIGGTLAVTGVATLSNNATVGGTLGVTGATTLSSTLAVTSNATVGGTLGVTGATTLSSTLSVSNNATVGGTLGVTGVTTLSSTLGVTGATTLSSTLSVSNNATVGGTLGVTGATTLSSTLEVTSNATVGGTLGVTGATTLSSTLGVTGATTLSSTLSVSNNATVGGTLGVTGATTLSSTLTTTDLATFNNGITLSGSTTPATEFFRITNGAGSPVTMFLVDSASGNTTVGGTLGVTGATTLSSTLAVNSTASFNSTISSLNTITGTRLISTQTTGTAPFTVSSTTRVDSLNADRVDGLDFAAVNASGTPGTDQTGGVAYAVNANSVSFVPPGPTGRLLQSNGVGAAPTWVTPDNLTAGNAELSANIIGGTAGQILYQGAPDVTNKLPIGTNNTVLTSSGTAPQWSTSLTLAGTISHAGLTPSAGTNIDQIYSITDNLTVTTAWVNTSVNAAELANGSYMVQVQTGTEFYTGIMSWYGANISSMLVDEIVLHKASAGTETSSLFLRIERTDNDTSPDMTLQISSSSSRTAANYTFKFRRLI